MYQTEEIDGVTYRVDDEGNYYDSQGTLVSPNISLDPAYTPIKKDNSWARRPNHNLDLTGGSKSGGFNNSFGPAIPARQYESGVVHKPLPKQRNPVQLDRIGVEGKTWDGKPYERNPWKPDISLNENNLPRGIFGAKDDQGRRTHRGFLGGILSGADELFNDPRRMALIAGGLRMADPNSYYDKQGFYSPWGGINAGLGTGIKTYKDLSAPKKLGFEAQEKIKHGLKMKQIREEAKSGSGMGEYRRLMQEYFSLKDTDPRKKMLKQRIDHMVRKEEPSSVQEWQFLSGLPTEDRRKYLAMKRASQIVNLGGTQGVLNQTDPTKLEAEFPVTLKPEQEISYIEDKVEAETATRINTKAVVAAKLTLPNSIESAGYMVALLDKAMKHPGMPDVIGLPDNPLALKGLMPGTDAADFTAVYNQITGKQFMEAYKTLKGGGQITEIEGKKATDAMARMSTSQSERAFLEALRDFREVVVIGLERQKTLAGVYRPGETSGGKPPDGVSQEEWDNMDEEDKKLWH